MNFWSGTMRKKLKNLGSQERHRFIGTVQKFGMKSSIWESSSTICLVNVKLCGENEILTDHIWLTVGKQLADMELQEGDIISFDARVDSYRKGYKGFIDGIFMDQTTKDYKLSRPTKIKLENRNNLKQLKKNKEKRIKLEKAPNILWVNKVNRNSIITFGKHKDKTLGQVIKEDFPYIVWMYDTFEQDKIGIYNFLRTGSIFKKIKSYKKEKQND